MFKYVTLALLGVASASFGMRDSTYLAETKAKVTPPTKEEIKAGVDAAKKKYKVVTDAKAAYDKAVLLESNIKACTAHAKAAKDLKDANALEKTDQTKAKKVTDATAAVTKAKLPKGVEAAKCKTDFAAAKSKPADVTDAKANLGLSIAFKTGTVANLQAMVVAGDVVFNQLLLTPHGELAAEETALGKQDTFYTAVATDAKTKKNADLIKAVGVMDKATKDLLKVVKEQAALTDAKKQKAGEAALNTAGKAYGEECLKASGGIALALAEKVTDAAVKGKLQGYAQEYKTNAAANKKANEAATGGSGGLTWLWIVLGLAIAGAGGYFLYTKLKKED